MGVWPNTAMGRRGRPNCGSCGAEQLTRDSGLGHGGLEQVNDERRRQGLPSIADQSDHFHLRQAGARACGVYRGEPLRALERASGLEGTGPAAGGMVRIAATAPRGG